MSLSASVVVDVEQVTVDVDLPPLAAVAASAEGPQGAQGPPGIQGPPGNPTPYELRGAGRPEGVVMASPATYYTDTAGTTGGWRWLKKAGSNVNGWVCIVGDTGWRDVLSLLTNGWTATQARLRRIDGMAHVQIVGLNGSAATAAQVLTLPAGFAMETSPNQPPPFMLATSSVLTTNFMSVGSTLSITGTLTNVTGHRTAASWPTSALWPAVLPGAIGLDQVQPLPTEEVDA